MSIWTTPSPSDFDRWVFEILAGDDPSHAAKKLGFGGSSSFKRTDPTRHAEVLEVWRERRDADDVKLARDTLREITADYQHPAAVRVSAASTLGKAAGMFDETQRIQLTGADGGPVAVTVEDARDKLAQRLAQIARPAPAAGADPKSQ